MISGFVYDDANRNGLFDPGESPIANSTIELRNASGVVVGQTTTDASGAYRFETDQTISTETASISRTMNFSNGDTFTHPMDFPQFNPDLGTLTSVEIIGQGFIEGQFGSENLVEDEGFTITANLDATLTLSAPGVGILVAEVHRSESFDASAFDGSADLGGTSGFNVTFDTGLVPARVTLTSASDLAAYTGTGEIRFILAASTSSSGTGAAELQTRRIVEAGGDVTVIYRYTPSNCLAAGDYTIVQTALPPGLIRDDGFESRDGVVLPGSDRTDVIPVTLGDVDLPNNNFGEFQIVTPQQPSPQPPAPDTPVQPTDVVPSSLSGFVYFDANNNGIKEAREFGISQVKVTLTGTDDLGQSVMIVTMTAADGFYSFTNLRPGTYRITETQPAAFITGKDTIGSLGGNTRRNDFSRIPVPAGVAGVQYNFGELSRRACKLNHFNSNAARGRPLPARPGPKIRFYLPDMVSASGKFASRRVTSGRN